MARGKKTKDGSSRLGWKGKPGRNAKGIQTIIGKKESKAPSRTI